MQDALADLKVPAKFRTRQVRDAEILDTIYGALKALLHDPWFSSLWTLQEAFIRPRTYLLPRGGRTALWDYNSLRIFLDMLAGPLLATLEPRLYEESATDEAAARTLSLILELATRAGLSTICESNVIAPYIASSSRTASREEDRIYAIQQIFGFRLGKTAIGFSDYSFTLTELRHQFATNLLAEYRCESQMFLHSKPAPVGTAWLPNDDSRVPAGIENYRKSSSRAFSDASNKESAEIPTCMLVVENFRGTPWASFTGSISSWSDFETIFTREEQDNSGDRLVLKICLDAADDEHSTGAQKPSLAVNGWGDELPSSLSSSLTGATAIILLLGHCEIATNAYPFAKPAAVGLILKPFLVSETQPCYRRLGFCVWHSGQADAPNDPNYLHSLEKPSSTARWKVVSGLFG